MILLYLVSTLYHALPAGSAKAWFNRLDHAAIYVFIAGSCAPFALGVLRGAWGSTLFGIVWGLAAAGAAAKLFNRLRHPWWSTGLWSSAAAPATSSRHCGTPSEGCASGVERGRGSRIAHQSSSGTATDFKRRKEPLQQLQRLRRRVVGGRHGRAGQSAHRATDLQRVARHAG